MTPHVKPASWSDLEANAHFIGVQEIIRREIVRGTIRVIPAPDSGIRIIPTGAHAAPAMPLMAPDNGFRPLYRSRRVGPHHLYRHSLVEPPLDCGQVLHPGRVGAEVAFDEAATAIGSMSRRVSLCPGTSRGAIEPGGPVGDVSGVDFEEGVAAGVGDDGRDR
jgi:hypothetical protein